MPLKAGPHTITLTVTDDVGASASATVTITVQQPINHAPIANAGPDQTIVATGAAASVTLDGRGSSDPDGDPLNYRWSEGGQSLATGANPMTTLPAGTHITSPASC